MQVVATCNLRPATCNSQAAATCNLTPATCNSQATFFRQNIVLIPTMTTKIKVLIIGSGPAGYTAAIYAARAGLNPVLYAGSQPGGQLTTTNDVENYPGYPDGINGPQMMIDLQKQAERFGTKVIYGMITSVDFSTYPLRAVADGKEQLEADAVIIATGASAKYLGIPSEAAFANKGVSACAVCDGFFYRGKEVAVVGAGDSAAEESHYLSKLVTKVHLLVRRDEMRASKIMQARVKATPNIQIYWNSETEEVLGDDSGVTGVRIKNNKTGKTQVIPIQGFFLAIGHTPNTDIFKGQLDMDEARSEERRVGKECRSRWSPYH